MSKKVEAVHRFAKSFALFGALFFLTSCSPPSNLIFSDSALLVRSAPQPNFGWINQNILQPKCVACHSGASPSAGIDLSSYSNVMSSGTVVPLQPAESSLHTSVQSGIMPPVGSFKLSATEVKAISDWILAGALNNTAGGSSLSITKVEPPSGPQSGGTRILLTGSGFVDGASIMIGNQACGNVQFQSSSQISCITSPASLSGPGFVKVTNPDLKSIQLASGFAYTTASPVSPTILTVSPFSGGIGGGTSISISGTNFSLGMAVSLGGVPCGSVNVLGPTSLSCITGGHPAGVTDVVVTLANFQAAVRTSGFTYLDPAPTIVSVSPASGLTTGGTPVTVTGRDFRSGAGVSLGGSICSSVNVVSSTEATCITGAHAAGVVSVVVTHPDGQSGTLQGGFSYLNPAPTLSALAPSSGSTNGGATLTLNGTGFLAGASVMIDGSICGSVAVVSSTKVTCIVPAHPTGSVSVVLTNGDGQSATLSNSFAYLVVAGPAPSISSVSPNSGPASGGTLVTINGSNFVSGMAVKIGGVTCGSPTFVSSVRITCVSGAGSAGPGDVVVTNPDTQTGTATNAYTYANDDPVLISVSPSSGVSTGGTSITLSGSNFIPGISVSVGGSPCGSVRMISSNQITCLTPPHAIGTVSVSAMNPFSSTSTLNQAFTYLSPPPVISGISPASGPMTGGTVLTIDGSGFLTGASVLVGGTACSSVVVVSATRITCTTPAHAAGAVNVMVTNTDTQSGTLGNGFQYLSSGPSVISVAPNSGVSLGGSSVTINGSNFASGASVSIGGVPCTGVVVVSASQLTCATGERVKGVVSVVVTNPDSQSSALMNGYTYTSSGTFTLVKSKILSPATNNCTSCHGSGTALRGLNYSTYTTTMSTGSVIANSLSSTLYTRTIDGSMPKNGTALTPPKQEAIQDWIMGGALNN